MVRLYKPIQIFWFASNSLLPNYIFFSASSRSRCRLAQLFLIPREPCTRGQVGFARSDCQQQYQSHGSWQPDLPHPWARYTRVENKIHSRPWARYAGFGNQIYFILEPQYRSWLPNPQYFIQETATITASSWAKYTEEGKQVCLNHDLDKLELANRFCILTMRWQPDLQYLIHERGMQE